MFCDAAQGSCALSGQADAHACAGGPGAAKRADQRRTLSRYSCRFSHEDKPQERVAGKQSNLVDRGVKFQGKHRVQETKSTAATLQPLAKVVEERHSWVLAR
jgi:hypothetical protein